MSRSLAGLLAFLWASLLASPATGQDSDAGPETGEPAVAQRGGPDPLLIGNVTVGPKFVAFSYAGDIWIAPRDGGEARPITTGLAEDDFPAFSPDGNHLAFSRQTADDWDVYVVPPQGGDVRRLTYHPEVDIVRGWSRDGERILFMSHRDEEGAFRLYTIPLGGVFPTALPLPLALEGSFGPNGDRIAYVPTGLPLDLSASEWDYYRGGLASGIWIARLSDSQVEKLPHDGSHDRTPMWAGRTIYFLSDRSGTTNLHAFNLDTKETQQITDFETFGVESAAFGDGVIALVQAGAIHIYDPRSGGTNRLEITVRPDTAQLAKRTVDVSGTLQSVHLSASGDTLVLGARGEVLLHRPSDDTLMNLTGTSGVAERFPVLSPDGRRVAYFSDESGDYQLHIRSLADDQTNRIPVELRPSIYWEPVWSHDSRRVAFVDRRLSLWIADAETGGARRATSSEYPFQTDYQPAFSPDGRWLAYSRYEASGVRRIWAHDLTTGQNIPISDGLADAETPTFDPTGRYLYFTVSNTGALTAGTEDARWGALSADIFRPLVSRQIYVATVRPGTPAPTYPIIGTPRPDAFEPRRPDTLARAGERPRQPPGQRPDPTGPPARGVPTREGVPQPRRRPGREGPPPRQERRLAPLPAPMRNYDAITAVRPGVLMLSALEWPDGPTPGASPTRNLYLYDVRDPKKTLRVADDVGEFRVARGALLYRQRRDWHLRPLSDSLIDAIASAEGGPTANAADSDVRTVDLSGLRIDIDPGEEWRQMYREAWRFARLYFYDPGYHGQDLASLETHYQAYLPSVVRRQDLNRLMGRMLGHLSVSHLAVGGGDIVDPPHSNSRIGLLGADYAIERNRYRITRIYDSGPIGESNPLLEAPLDQPGIDIQPGDYLLTVDGDRVDATRNLYSYFEGKALRPVQIEVAPEPEGREDRRTYTVVPTPGENTLRRIHWAEQNRKRVDERTRSRLGYIYVPNFGRSGIERFMRELAAYSDRQGFIIDVRFNRGGTTADYLADWLKRDPLYYYTFREGQDLAMPLHALRGPRVLLINGVDFSAAETFAFMFKLRLTGTVMGQRTAGAGIGHAAFIPELIDGGRVAIPNRAAYNPEAGTWDIENDGVEPDIEVDWRPAEWRAGRDTQLEEAINTALTQLAENPPLEPKRPAPPRYP